MMTKVTFKISYIRVRRGEVLGVTGSCPELGEWNKPVLLDDKDFPVWKGSVTIKGNAEYKFVIADKATGAILRWEDGFNRSIDGQREICLRPRLDDGSYKAAGVAIPVFSLRSKDSFGVGEFTDIKKMVDWAEASGQSFIQLLPINDTTMTRSWQDSYPYNANSSFALHPQFLNITAAGVKKTAAYKKLQSELNALPKEDYERVNDAKEVLMRELYAQKGADVLASAPYKKFLAANGYWLKPYAVFCALRDEKKTADFSRWGRMAKYTEASADKYFQAHRTEVEYYYYIQFLLDKQLRDAVDYAHAHRVVLKGDLPIGISRTSVDAWCHPELFNMDSQAGAPPDAFAADGQNWGFPTYNWDEMAKDGYAWWKARLGKMAEYFDAFRIDHILGFFRIWEIPMPEKSGLMGHFSPAMPYPADEIGGYGLPLEGLFLEDPHSPGMYHPKMSAQNTDAYAALEGWQKDRYNAIYNDFFYHRHNGFWKEQAMKKLPALLGSTGMMACGEDLGMIPACVPDVMASMNILSLEIQRMPKDPGLEFGRPEWYPYTCVCTSSTHDMTPVRAWWEEEDKDSIQRFYNQRLGRQGIAPEGCGPDICEQIVAQHLYSPAMLTILPLQDWVGMDGDIRYGLPAEERINVPAIPRYYWRYRMHLTLEELLGKADFNSKVLELVTDCGR